MEHDFNFENTVKDALREALKERGHINILIAGRTGVGKSTLINAIFQGNLATTGQGRPVTQNTREIKKEDIPISIFDTRGLEMADFSKTIGDLQSFVRERSRNTDPKEHIHVAWICISDDLRRVEPAEEQLVEMLADYMPVIAILTKSIFDDGFKVKVQELLPLTRNVMRIRAIPQPVDGGYVLPPIGLCDLVEVTIEAVPEGLRRAFTAAQKVDIELKKTQSHMIVATAAASATAIAMSPIPFSDALLIVPVQVAMLAGISATFGISFNESFLSSLVGSVVTGAGGTFAGRAIVSALLKFIPVAGSALGGMIVSSTALALTTAFGEAYIAALEMLFIRNDGQPPTSDDVVEAFKERYALSVKG